MALQKYSRIQLFVIALLLFFLAAQVIAGMLHNSIVWDELCYIGAGKAIFSTGYMRYMVLADHPPLSYYLNSIPLIPLKFDSKIWQSNSCWQISHDVIFNSGYDPNKILLIARLPFLLLSIALGIFVLKWSRELYGNKSGILALFLYSFSPSIIAYSGLAIADFTAAAMIFIATYYFWKLVKEPSKKHLILAGIFFGLAQLSKITAIILFPLYFIVGIAAIYNKKNKLALKALAKKLLVIFIIGFVLIWAFHKFQFGTLKDSLPPVYYSEKAREEIGKLPVFSEQLLYVYDKAPIPMPIYFGMLGNIFYLSLQEKTNFVFGEITDNVVWYFALLSFILKTNPALLIALALLIIFYKRLPKLDAITNLSLLLPVVLIFIVFSITNKIAGINHILAVYPFLFVLASNIVNFKIKNSMKTLLLTLFIFSYAISPLIISPYYLSYINILGGGSSNAYKIIVGANFDQGQDLLELKKYMEENNIDKIKLSYWGSVDPSDYGISFEYLPSPYFQPWLNNYTHIISAPKNIVEDCSPKKGLIAISATNLQNVHLNNRKCFDWLKQHEPVTRIGYSIFVYDIR